MTADRRDLAPAAACVVHHYHRPAVHEYARHHIFPAALGGPTQADNLVDVCPTGHVNIHVALRELLTAWIAGIGHEEAEDVVDLHGFTLTERDVARAGLRAIVGHYGAMTTTQQAAYRAELERFLGHRARPS